MFVGKKLCIVLVGICMVVVYCDTNYYSDYLSNQYKDYAKKLSSYIRKVGEVIEPDSPHDDGPPKKRSPSAAVDTYYKPKNDDNQRSDATSCYEELHKCWTTKSTDISDNMLSRRIVNMLLHRAELREEGSVLKRYIVIETSVSEQEALKKFGLGELTLREIDPILNNAIKTAESKGFFKYVYMFYTFCTKVRNYALHHKGTVVSFVVLFCLFDALYNVKWNFRTILSSSIQVLLSIIFLISWWRVLQKNTASQNAQLPIQCQPDKMRWIDKAVAWVYNFDCDKHYETQTKNSLSENIPEEEFVDALLLTFAEMPILTREFLRWIPYFMTMLLPQILGWIFALAFGGLLPLSIFFCLMRSLYGFANEPRRTYLTIKNNILKALSHVQTQVQTGNNNTESGNEEPLLDENMYYKISCGTDGRSVILKTKTGARSLGKSKLEMKIRSILGKSMKVEEMLGRIATREGVQVTVAMKRKEDKDELIERWQELRDNGIFVEEDIILLDKRARWNMLGLTIDERVKEKSRKISINEEVWIWDDKARKWVQNILAEDLRNIKDSIAEATL